jgi:hypothetical protein
MGRCIAMHPSRVYGNTSEQTGTHKALLISRAFARAQMDTTARCPEEQQELT